MKLLTGVLCLCLTLALTPADVHERGPHHVEGHDGHNGHNGHNGHEHGHGHGHGHGHLPDRCEGLEMDAVTVNEDGVPHFFQGQFLFKGFDGHAEPSNHTFPELVVPIDAAFHMEHEDDAHMYNGTFLFSHQDVYRYHGHKLEEGFPKRMAEDFPGVPEDLDAAIECPKEDCGEDSVIFFKGNDIIHFVIKTKTVNVKEFDSMPNCTSALRFMGQYFCFHGHKFSKFDPKTGAVHGRYPKEARDFFMRCPTYSNNTDHVEREQCSHVHLDAVTGDGDGNLYAFRGHHFLRKHNTSVHAGPIEASFKEVHSEVDAVFIYDDHFHMIKDDQMYRYTAHGGHNLVDGYPKPLREEMGLDGPVDAAFICDDDIAHVIKGPNMISVNMTTHSSEIEHPIFSFQKVDAAFCHDGHVTAIVGNHFYNFKDAMEFVTGKTPLEPHSVSMELFGCDH
ncbi:hemopexin [Halichoeres trimaculatus]|uniref:hemopexin n=1 Tax=Halichoeres trimaculatus TaxID=147232 RepID=UPI003D9F28BD